MSVTARTIAISMVMVVLIPLAGLAFAFVTVDRGLDELDVPERRAAEDALVLVLTAHDNPLQRLVTPVASVVSVTPVICKSAADDHNSQERRWSLLVGEERAWSPRAGSDFPSIQRAPRRPPPPYRIRVRVHTVFGVDVADYVVTCGEEVAPAPRESHNGP